MIILQYITIIIDIELFLIDKLKAKEGKLTEEEARGKTLMNKEINNSQINVDSIKNADKIALEDWVMSNDKMIIEAKRVIETCEKQNLIAKYAIKIKSKNVNNSSYKDAFESIDELKAFIRSGENGDEFD